MLAVTSCSPSFGPPCELLQAVSVVRWCTSGHAAVVNVYGPKKAVLLREELGIGLPGHGYSFHAVKFRCLRKNKWAVDSLFVCLNALILHS